MTEEQITKALECCVAGKKCRNCPLETDDACFQTLRVEALELINSQKATIDELTKAYKTLKSEKEAEIERLQKEKFDSLNCQFVEMYSTTLNIAVKKAKSEAIKEFAKEFVDDLSHMLTYDKDYIKAKIFHLVEIKTKEMEGDGDA